MVVDSIEDLEAWLNENWNPRLKGVIKRFKYSQQLDEQIIALATIIQSLRRKGVRYTEHFLQHCLLYLIHGGGVE